MRISLLYREQIASLKSHLVDELDELVSTIGGWAATEHDDDGRHTDITADSVTTDLLTAITAVITNITISGTITLPLFTQGSVLFAGVGGVVSQDNAGFNWDDVNNRLFVGSLVETQFTLASDINNISPDTDVFVRFVIDGGTLKSLMGYDQGLDRFVFGYNAGQLSRIDNAGNLAIPQSLQVGLAALPGAGSQFIVFGDGTAPTSPASNTALLYGDDFGGTVALRGINEAGDVNQITQGFIPTPRDKAPGSFTVPTGRFIFMSSPTFSGSEIVTLQGTATMVIV